MKLKVINEIISETIKERKAPQLTEEEKDKVMRMLNEASEKSNVKKKGKKKKSKQVLKHQVVSLLSQDKIDMAAIGREVYPKMDDDTLRSYISKIARGKEQIPDNKVNDFFKALRTFNGKKTKK